MTNPVRLIAALVPLGSLLLGGCASTGTTAALGQPDTITLGRNTQGDPCSATRTWSDPAVTDTFDVAYSITCRTVSASRAVGALRVVKPGSDAVGRIEKSLNCGEGRSIDLAGGARTAEVKRCYDSQIGSEVVAVSLENGGRRLIATAAPSLLGPLEEGVAILSGARPASGDAGRTVAPTIALTALAALPASTDAAVMSAELFDPAALLVEGISLNHKGQNVQASRVLNDALSRLPAGAKPAIVVELQLEAGLADSNIRFADAAKEHFDRADTIFAAEPAARTPFLQRKRDSYRALDLLNQRQFRAALTALEAQARAPVGGDQPLRDLATVRTINQPDLSRTDTQSSLSLPDTTLLSQIVLDAQTNWARSVAYLALGDEAGASRALNAADAAFRPLQGERIDQVPVLWLGSRIERQRARLQARRSDWAAAVASMDRALLDLRRSAIATAGTGNEPAIAELQLERASIIARRGSNPEEVRSEYGLAVDALVAAGNTGGALPVGLEGYLDLLIAEAATPRADTFERYFRALQGTGEPAVARQLSQLQAVVAADQSVGVKLRDKAELERDVTRLRYAIADAAKTPGTSTTALEAERQAAESKLIAVENDLSTTSRYGALDDRPATVAEIRAVLKPGEGYLKVAEVNGRLYAMYVGNERSFIYAIAPSPAAARAIETLAGDVRASIDGQLLAGKLVPFAVDKAYALFRIISGPATEEMLAAKALVIDPAGPLQSLPIGVLVTKFDKASQPADPFDNSTTAFLAAKAALSTAVSPRSFLVARALAPSKARQPFLGLGEHQPTAPTAPPDEIVNVGFGCAVPRRELQSLSGQAVPISKRELEVAATALGYPSAPLMIDAAFSDTAVQTRPDLDQFEVLHFATHGLPEGVWGCTKSPPALVTSFGDRTSDGLLSFSEIAALRLDANLVVLSACETASGVKDQGLARSSGQEEAGATLEGLVRAFLAANARAVLATYWQVSAGKESEDFIRTFYETARTAPIGGSLQAAQVALMRQPQFSHPFYWGGFFVVGDSSKMMLSTATASVQAGAPAGAAR